MYKPLFTAIVAVFLLTLAGCTPNQDDATAQTATDETLPASNEVQSASNEIPSSEDAQPTLTEIQEAETFAGTMRLAVDVSAAYSNGRSSSSLQNRKLIQAPPVCQRLLHPQP